LVGDLERLRDLVETEASIESLPTT
jgi:hypothetical protein